jgi:hypothetical protein
MRHVSDIAEKYLVPGETQDTALMFVPSESVYAEIHDGFDDIIQKAYRARIVLVSPSLLMLAIQVMQQILKDARMRDAADQIRTEVMHLGDDLGRLRDRVLKLQNHFAQANEDVRQILISADRIEKRAGRIEELDFSKADAPDLVPGGASGGIEGTAAQRSLPSSPAKAGDPVFQSTSVQHLSPEPARDKDRPNSGSPFQSARSSRPDSISSIASRDEWPARCPRNTRNTLIDRHHISW